MKPVPLSLGLALAAAILLGLAVSAPAHAQITLTTGANLAIAPGAQDRAATFDSVTTFTPLSAYTEDSLSITVNNVAYTGFDPTWGNGGFSGGFHYPNGGAISAASIKMTDGAKLGALEFNVGTGFEGTTGTFFSYFAFNNGTQIQSGSFEVPSGTVLGFSDPSGFDELRIGTYASLVDAQNATPDSYQAVALDNLRVKLASPASPVPEPGSLALLATGGMPLLGCLRRRLV